MYLVYTETRTGGEICAGEEDDDWPSYEDEFINFHPVSLHINRPKDWHINKISTDLEPNIGDYLYIVIARYFDGGTFGTTYGHWQIMGAEATMKKAEALREKTYKDKNKEDNKIYKPWIGYFAGLELIEIHPMRVEV